MIWIVSIKWAFTTLNCNSKLIGIVLIAVVASKDLDLIGQFADQALYELIGDSLNLDVSRHARESS